MNVKLVLLAFAAVVCHANGQFPFGNGGMLGQSGMFNLPSFGMFRPPLFRPPTTSPLFGSGSNQFIPPFLLPFFSQLGQRPPRPTPPQQPALPIAPPTDLDDLDLQFVTPEEISDERPGFPQIQPGSLENNEPVAVVGINEPSLSTEVISDVLAEQPTSEENLFAVPQGTASEENLFARPDDSIQVEDDTLIGNDENEGQAPLLVQSQVVVEEELPQEIAQEFIR